MTEPTNMDLERRKRDRAESLQEDLQSTLSLMVRVARGEQTVYEMGQWVSLNYPSWRHQLPASMRATPPKT
jgi:hypothetical protein